ncbi:hypothetical protein [Cupriavidus necator]
MTTTCITCEHFTLKPRSGEGVEHLRASDIAHARVGMGRCTKEAITVRWISANSECERPDDYAAVSEEQAAQRREWIKGRRV